MNKNPETLEAAITKINRSYGDATIMRLGDAPAHSVPALSSGSLGLDIALGVNGYPLGRIVELYGPESSGKTSLALAAIASCQKGGGIAAFIDAEHALDTRQAQVLGVNTDDLLVSQPDTGEQALEIVEALVRTNSVDLIVVDSVAALVPKAEIDGEMGDSHVGLQARLMSQAMRKLTGPIHRSNCCVIFINQLREKVGVMFGSPEVTTGGRALKFYASVRVDVRRIESLKKLTEVIGIRIRVKVQKNKVAPPFKSAEIDLMFATGIDHEQELLQLGVLDGLIVKAGSWCSYGDTRLGQGEAAKRVLHENPELAAEIKTKLQELHHTPALVIPPVLT